MKYALLTILAFVLTAVVFIKTNTVKDADIMYPTVRYPKHLADTVYITPSMIVLKVNDKPFRLDIGDKAIINEKFDTIRMSMYRCFIRHNLSSSLNFDRVLSETGFTVNSTQGNVLSVNGDPAKFIVLEEYLKAFYRPR